MKNFMVYITQDHTRKWREWISKFLHAQIDNAFRVGWKQEDIVLVLNDEFEYQGIKAHRMDSDVDFCPCCPKQDVLLKCFQEGIVQDDVWMHDLDVWQSYSFDFPLDEDKDFGYTTVHEAERMAGGVLFYRYPQAIDIMEAFVVKMREWRFRWEEKALTRFFFREGAFEDRIQKVHRRFNFGKRSWERGWKLHRAKHKVRGIHFHPDKRTRWTKACLKNFCVDGLKEILIKYFGDQSSKT